MAVPGTAGGGAVVGSPVQVSHIPPTSAPVAGS